MSSSKEYLQYALEQLGKLSDITHRPMMGEYIIYYKEKIIGGIYDDRFLIKPTEAAKKLIDSVSYEIPYDGAKEMILVEEMEDKEFLENLITSMYDELPEPKTKKRT